jgi:hypothetical protein
MTFASLAEKTSERMYFVAGIGSVRLLCTPVLVGMVD